MIYLQVGNKTVKIKSLHIENNFAIFSFKETRNKKREQDFLSFLIKPHGQSLPKNNI